MKVVGWTSMVREKGRRWGKGDVLDAMEAFRIVIARIVVHDNECDVEAGQKRRRQP